MIDNTNNNIESNSLLPYMLVGAAAATCVLTALARSVYDCIFKLEDDGSFHDDYIFPGPDLPDPKIVREQEVQEIATRVKEILEKEHEAEQAKADAMAREFGYISDPEDPRCC